MADQNIREAERAMGLLRATKPWAHPVTVDPAWSSRAFNIGMIVGVFVGGPAVLAIYKLFF